MLRVLNFTKGTATNFTPTELHYGSSPRTEFTNFITDNKSYLSDRTNFCSSATRKQIPFSEGGNEKTQVKHHFEIARKRIIPSCSVRNSTMKKQLKLVSDKQKQPDTVFHKKKYIKTLNGNIREETIVYFNGRTFHITEKFF